MKKYLFIAAVAALAFVSCQQEKDIDVNKVPAGENNVSFVLQSGAPTRSGEVTSPVRKGFSVEIGQVDDQAIYLEETITDLGYSEPETKGTPLYTENLGYLYRSKLDVHVSTYTTGDVTFVQNGNQQAIEDFWHYSYEYPTNIWGNRTTDKVHFAFRMPSSMTSNGVSDLQFNGNATTFKYASPETASATQDIVFGGVTKTFPDYIRDYGKDGGTKVMLYHALTGVKFAIANAKKDGKLEYDIQIKEISFTGLANTGTCTFTPGADGLDGGNIAWDARTVKAEPENNVIKQTFDPGDLVDFDKDSDGNHFAESYFDGGTKQNINDAQASKTFWLIPQAIDQNTKATITIKFSMNGKDQEMTIKMKELNTSDWMPAQIRTYTFKIDEINLKIRDELEMHGNANDGYKDSVKKNVQITNTSNTRAFIRAAIVGQWVDVNNDPVFGFTDEVNKLYVVASWYDDQFGPNAPHNQGLFVGLPGYGNTPNPKTENGWQLCKDGYYYYMTAVEPGAIVPALFDTYTVGTIPNASLAGAEIENTDMHFELEIATQAIKANKLDGTPDTWTNAWKDALGGVAPVIQ